MCFLSCSRAEFLLVRLDFVSLWSYIAIFPNEISVSMMLLEFLQPVHTVSWLEADTKLSVRVLAKLPCSPPSDTLRPGWIAVPQPQWKLSGEGQSHCHCFA